MNRFVVALLVVFLAAAAQAGWWDDAGAARRANLDAIRKDPERWRDVVVVLDVKFARVAEPGNAYFTRFTAREWRAVGVFAIDATSKTMAGAEPFERIFVRRGGAAERRLAELASGRRMQIRGTVRDAVKGEPWIEAFEIVADGDALTPEETAALARAESFLSHENAAAAEPLLRELQGKRALPQSVQADLWRKIGAACWSQRRHKEAVEAYAAALAIEPEDAPTAERLATAREALASGPSVEPTNSGSTPASGPTPPASFGSTPPAPARRLLPPTGLGIDDAHAPATPSPAAAPRPAADVPAPAPPADEPTPPPAPRPRLSGPK